MHVVKFRCGAVDVVGFLPWTSKCAHLPECWSDADEYLVAMPSTFDDGYTSADESGLSHAEKAAGAWEFAQTLGGTVILFVYSGSF